MATLRADVAIIGSGSGNSLITPFWDDKQVVLAEKGLGPTGAFGGTCLNAGCIPTKMFVRPATVARAADEARRLGVSMEYGRAEWADIRDRIFGRVDAIAAGGEDYRKNLPHVTLIPETVTCTGGTSVTSASGTEIEPAQLVIAAGSRPVLPDIPGIDLPQVHTSDSIMRLEHAPNRLLIVGGGYIACEFAGIFSGLGTDVIQINRSQGLLRAADEDISQQFSAQAEQTWDVRYERTVGAITQESATAHTDSPTGAPVTVEVICSDGTVEQITVDAVLVAIGRQPNSDTVGAKEAGFDLHADGRIAVDQYQRVLSGGEPVTGVYALGDISSAPMLKHVANHEARVVAHNLENPEDLRASRREPIPAAVFSYPEVAQVGLTEAEAIEAHGREHITSHTQRYGDTAYGWAMEDSSGLFKVIADRRTGTILGAHAVGYQSSNLIQPIVQAMSFGQDAYTAARGQYWIHPALMEVTENALLGLDVPVPDHAPL